MTFYKTLGSIPEAQNRLDAATYNALKNIIGTMSQDSIVTPSVEEKSSVSICPLKTKKPSTSE